MFAKPIAIGTSPEIEYANDFNDSLIYLKEKLTFWYVHILFITNCTNNQQKQCRTNDLFEKIRKLVEMGFKKVKGL